MIGKLKTVVLDAADITALSTFYVELAGWRRAYADADWVTLTTDDGWRIVVQSAPDHRMIVHHQHLDPVTHDDLLLSSAAKFVCHVQVAC